MKNECMVPPVTRYENSTSLETLLSCLLTSAAHWAHQNTFLSDTTGKSSLLSESRAVSSDTAKQGQHSTFHRACRAAENISMACLQEEAHSAQALSCLQTQIQSWPHHHAAPLTLLTKAAPGLTSKSRQQEMGLPADALRDTGSVWQRLQPISDLYSWHCSFQSGSRGAIPWPDVFHLGSHYKGTWSKQATAYDGSDVFSPSNLSGWILLLWFVIHNYDTNHLWVCNSTNPLQHLCERIHSHRASLCSEAGDLHHTWAVQISSIKYLVLSQLISLFSRTGAIRKI